ncbi:helix-turn-helix domain-containing protein [Kribbella jiaozuonensis]|uniref:Tetratricopeptide repeat protein n=1 Tax=Kribbella jiaozuonensis TaxID=2575441 RepID=A0A4U3LI60_9ACTN|nr:helix-turn-helix domain-containing protein [Kribbella jiaozuonensis]TKK75200.1 tetratricopeptide repeat protein [Kribbella jiaozuonensis]
MAELSTTLSELLRTFRTRSGLTQAALAEKAGLSEQAISVLERGTRSRPRMDTIRGLTKALDLTPAEADQFLAVARGKGHGSAPATQAADATAGVAASPVPWQLPPAARDFTGRGAQLDAMLSVLRNPTGSAPVGLVAVTGMGGIGKTALAVQAAHILTDSYPDGQLYLNLRGYGPGTPMAVADAQRQLLRSVGVDVRLIPGDVEEAAAVLRSELAGRRLLILLDNAVDITHVLPLLPGHAGSSAIITSRGSLATLAGARQVHLDALSESESVELLTGVIGEARVAAEPDAARNLTAISGRLPLAVRLIGGRLASRPTWPIHHLVAVLQDEKRRLDGFGSDENSVRASIASSVDFLDSSDRPLDRDAAGVLPLLSVLDGSDLLTVVASRLLELPLHRTDAILERLVDLNLLESVAPERYRFHDLIRAYARERADEILTTEERDAGVQRALRLYTEIGWAVQSRTHPANPRIALATAPFEPLPTTSDTEAALSWLDDEQRNLTDRYHQASQSSLARTAEIPELVLSLFGYLESRSRWVEMREMCGTALEIATQLELGPMAAWLEHDTAIPEVENGSLEAAAERLLRALARFRALPDLRGQARCCTSIAHVLGRLNRVADAIDYGNEALQLSQELGDETVVGVAHVALGALYDRNGDYALADASYQRGIKLAEQSQDSRSVSKRYLNTGFSHLLVGRVDDAVGPLLKSLDAAKRGKSDDLQTQAMQGLAGAHASRGEYREAHAILDEGIVLVRALGNRLREGSFILEHGKISAAEADFPAATRYLESAMEILHTNSPHLEVVAAKLLEDVRHGHDYVYRFDDSHVT